MDSISKESRSENMRRIKSKGMKSEMRVRRLVHSMGFRYRLHDVKLPGKPDLVFAGMKKIIEVRGCFWHQHQGCKDSHVPKSNATYWGPKLERNTTRDVGNLASLHNLGWSVLVIWECEVDDQTLLGTAIQTFLQGHPEI